MTNEKKNARHQDINCLNRTWMIILHDTTDVRFVSINLHQIILGEPRMHHWYTKVIGIWWIDLDALYRSIVTPSTRSCVQQPIFLFFWFMHGSCFLTLISPFLNTSNIFWVKGRKGGIVWTILATYNNFGAQNSRHRSGTENKVKHI